MSLKKICIAIISLVLLSGCASFDTHYVSQSVSSALTSSKISTTPAEAYVDNRITTTFVPKIARYYYNKLETDVQRSLYDAMLYSVLNLEPKTKVVKGSITDEQIRSAIEAVKYDYPQIFYLYNNYTPMGDNPTQGGINTAVYVQISYLYNNTTRIPAQQADLYRVVNEILEQAKAYFDPYERQLFLYETIINKVTYDYSEAATPGSNPYAHTAYGALVQGKAVCDGYAQAFHLLCSYSGIEATLALGTSRNQDHAWNLVWHDGEPYYNDLTWDDVDGWYYANGALNYTTSEIPQGAVKLPAAPSHTYFNVSFDEISKNHTFDTRYDYPTGASLTYNYFIKNDLILTKENWNTLIAKGLRDAAAAGKPFAEFRLGSGVVDSTTPSKVASAITKELADELGIIRKVYITDSAGYSSFGVFLMYRSYETDSSQQASALTDAE